MASLDTLTAFLFCLLAGGLTLGAIVLGNETGVKTELSGDGVITMGSVAAEIG